MYEKPLLIIQCDTLALSAPALYERGGEMADFFLALTSNVPTIVVRADAGISLPEPETVRGAMITGSTAMVTDERPWIANTASWVRAANDHQTPLLGVCFGHQLITRALGGNVCALPSPEYGTIGIERIVDDDPLFGDLPSRFDAQFAHFQTVERAPANSRVVARGKAGIQALRFGPRSWGVQFHPEFDVEDMDRIIRSGEAELSRAGLDCDAARAKLRETPEARGIVRRFAQLTTI